jgi:hypothetical protein
VTGDVRSDASDAVARCQPFHATAYGLDDARARVARGEDIVEACAYRGEGRAHAVAHSFIEYLASLVGPVERLADEAALRRPRDCTLRAGRDERETRGDEDLAAPGLGVGDLDDLDPAGAKVLDELPHEPGP